MNGFQERITQKHAQDVKDMIGQLRKRRKNQMKMPKISIGHANHVHDSKDISSIEISIIQPPRAQRLSSFVTLGSDTGEDSIIINSLEQWKQIDAFVLKAFDQLDS